MSAIEIDEIRVGLVVFLDPKVLQAEDAICITKDPPFDRSGPFICVEAGSVASTWAPVTTQYRKERLALRREWRSGGHPQWMRDRQFLGDGADLWHGPNDVFVQASYQESTGRKNRARVSQDGVEAINTEVAAQRSRRDRSYD